MKTTHIKIVTKYLRNTLYILASILIFSSCVEKTKTIGLNKSKFYYPSKSDFENDSTITQITLDSLKNFNELVDKIDKIVCTDSIPVINFENTQSEFKIMPMNSCSSEMACFRPFLVTISPDSIRIDYHKKIGIENLFTALELNLLNKDKNPLHGDSPAKTIFEVQVDSIYNIKKTSDLLVKIVNSYNELNKKNKDSLFLKIWFSKRKSYPPPPHSEFEKSE
ncbi:hypothetical protein GCM10007962_25250 [Yeosuana aromativorans]|uniref:Lipoprotein n=1 Tax=Yeosuana aromativorans TaxID=288019 RepID=A0A8J3BPZ8_9FLAO|nr:hypothetical protein [Yeosuana aromativorans]GGK29922.1 hypothetical protein GCM10007962_25250 [Yeosuana aromativorans]